MSEDKKHGEWPAPIFDDPQKDGPQVDCTELVKKAGLQPPVTVNEHKRSKPRKPRQTKPGPRSHERIASDLVKQAQRVKDAEARLGDARKAWDALLREAAEVGK